MNLLRRGHPIQGHAIRTMRIVGLPPSHLYPTMMIAMAVQIMVGTMTNLAAA